MNAPEPERYPKAYVIGISVSSQFLAKKSNSVESARPRKGDTEKVPEMGGPFTKTRIEVIALEQVNENMYVDLFVCSFIVE